MNRLIHLRFQNYSAIVIFCLVVFLVALQGCSGIPVSTITPAASERLPSPIPPFIATDQASAIQARSTIQAGEAMANKLSLTGTAVALEVNRESTQVALQLTSSAATEQYFARQTQVSGQTTATSISVEATQAAGTQEAIWAAVIQSATATQMTLNHYVQATSTQLAVNELIRQDQSQRQSLEFRTWDGRISLLLAFAFGLFLIWKATPWVLLKFFGFQSWNGKPIIVVPDRRGGFQIVDIGRSFGPGIIIEKEGRVLTAGSHANEEIQNAVTARAQAAELMLSTGNLPPELKKRYLQQASSSIAPVQKPGLPEEIAHVEFRILPPDDHRVGEWLQEVEEKLLEDGSELSD